MVFLELLLTINACLVIDLVNHCRGELVITYYIFEGMVSICVDSI